VRVAAGPLYDRLGAKPIVSAEATFFGLDIFLLSFGESNSDYASLVPWSATSSPTR
jgi:hypothetical protein